MFSCDGGYILRTPFLLVVLTFAILVSGCQTDRERYNIQDPEPVTIPVGMMPAGLENNLEFSRTHAGQTVKLYFGAHLEKLKKDPEFMFQGLALYEFLINELQHWDSKVPPYMIVDILKSRKEIREAIGLPKDISANKAINQLYSMSKFMAYANTQERKKESADVAARRDVVEKYKAKVTFLLKKIKSQQDADKKQKDVGGK